jgi:TrmH family RNA methyltransferase
VGSRAYTLLLMSADPISSRQHPFVQRCRALAAGRGEAGEVLLDGPHLLEDALEAGVPIVGVMVDERVAEVTRQLTARQVPMHVATRAVVDAASPVQSPSGVVTIARWAPSAAATLVDAARPLLLGLIGVQDPGNVGNIIRTADAMGASGVFALEGTAGPAGWKALRGAMGSTFRVPVASDQTDAVLSLARARGIRLAVTVVAGGVPPDAASLAAPVLVLIGSEGAGLPAAVTSVADVRITVPMRSRIESLNAATTAAIVLWEMTRPQRTRGEVA